MATAQAAPSSDVSAFTQRAQRRQLEAALHSLHAPDGEERLQALATHMVDRRLVRARGHAGPGHLRQLDVTLLREALSRLLRDDLDQGRLIVQAVLEGADPAAVSAERGVSRPALVEQLRAAVGALATAYERLAGGELNQWPAGGLRTARAGKRG